MSENELIELQRKRDELEATHVNYGFSARDRHFINICLPTATLLLCLVAIYGGYTLPALILIVLMIVGLILVVVMVNQDERNVREYEALTKLIKREESGREATEWLKQVDENVKQNNLAKQKMQSAQNARLKAIRTKRGN